MSARNARESRGGSWGHSEEDIEEIQSVINESDSDEGSGIRFMNEGKDVTGSAKASEPLQSQMMWPTYEEDEDEDSDGAGHPEYIPPKRKKKRATRMRSAERRKTRMAKTRRSPAREDRTDSSSGGRPSNSPTRTAGHDSTPQRRDSSSAFVSSVGTRSDLESSYSDQSPNRSYDEVEDANFGFGKDDRSGKGSKNESKREDNDRRRSRQDDQDEVSLDDLKEAFKGSKSTGSRDRDSLTGYAETSRLVWTLRYTLGASQLAEKLQNLRVSTVSWSTLLRLAQPYLDRNYQLDSSLSPLREREPLSSGLASVEESENETETDTDFEAAERRKQRKPSVASLVLDSDVEEGESSYALSSDRSERLPAGFGYRGHGDDDRRRNDDGYSFNNQSGLQKKSPPRKDRLTSLREESVQQLDIANSSDNDDEGKEPNLRQSGSTNLSYSRSSIRQESDDELVSTDARIQALKTISRDSYSPKKGSTSSMLQRSPAPDRTTSAVVTSTTTPIRIDIGRKSDVGAYSNALEDDLDDGSPLAAPQISYADNNSSVYDDEDARFPTVAPPSAKPPLPPTKDIPPEYMHLLGPPESQPPVQPQVTSQPQQQPQSQHQPPFQPRRSSRDPVQLPPRPTSSQQPNSVPMTQIASSSSTAAPSTLQQPQPTDSLQLLVPPSTSDIAARRSVSWSAVGPGKSAEATTPVGARRPGGLKPTALSPGSPRSPLQRQDQNQNQNQKTGKFFSLPPLSDYALKTGVVFEGWLKKKSMNTGFWQKRYCILAESKEHLFVMKIFYKASETAWGTIPMRQKTEIPIEKFCGVAASSVKMSKGKEFTLTFKKKIFEVRPGEGSGSGSGGGGGGTGTSGRRNSDAGYSSGYSTDPPAPADAAGGADGTSTSGVAPFDESFKKVMVLKAPDVQMRMIWVAMFERAIEALYEED